MKLEDLINLGLTEEQAKSVQALHKSEIDGNYVPKATFDAERQKIKDRDATIADRDKQISELGAFKGDNEALKKKVEELTSQNVQAQKEYEQKVAELEMDSAIRLEVMDKVHSVDDILSKLDRQKLICKDGKIISGLTEQLEEIHKTSPHYFKTEPQNQEGNQSLPPGWAPFGKTPAEGNNNMTGNNAEDFGKNLAQYVNNTGAVAQKASELYFQ